MAFNVASDGEVRPFSIFDSIPGESPETLASSATVNPWSVRKARTCLPMASSSAFSETYLDGSCPGVDFDFDFTGAKYTLLQFLLVSTK
jgi:hypothetical protein